jgi:hypothetical protein
VSRWRADRVGTKGIIVAYTVGCKAVDVWCFYIEIAVCTEAILAVFIGLDDEDVELVGHGCSKNRNSSTVIELNT